MKLAKNVVLSVLSRHIGERNGVHVRRLADELVDWCFQNKRSALGCRIAASDLEREIRKTVLELRRDGHHICAHPAAGYYIAETAEELDRTCLFLYDRAMASLQQVAAMRKISLPDLRGQLRLPT